MLAVKVEVLQLILKVLDGAEVRAQGSVLSSQIHPQQTEDKHAEGTLTSTVQGEEMELYVYMTDGEG